MAWVKFVEQFAAVRLKRLSTERLQAECNELTMRIDALERQRRHLFRELDRRCAKWPEEGS